MFSKPLCTLITSIFYDKKLWHFLFGIRANFLIFWLIDFLIDFLIFIAGIPSGPIVQDLHQKESYYDLHA